MQTASILVRARDGSESIGDVLRLVVERFERGNLSALEREGLVDSIRECARRSDKEDEQIPPYDCCQ